MESLSSSRGLIKAGAGPRVPFEMPELSPPDPPPLPGRPFRPAPRPPASGGVPVHFSPSYCVSLAPTASPPTLLPSLAWRCPWTLGTASFSLCPFGLRQQHHLRLFLPGGLEGWFERGVQWPPHPSLVDRKLRVWAPVSREEGAVETWEDHLSPTPPPQDSPHLHQSLI